MKRKLKDLSRRQMSIIALDYANTPNTKSGEFFAEKYNISESTFHNVLHKAIVESIVTESVARLIANKAAANTERHGGEGAKKRTLEVYEGLIRERKNCRLGREEAKKLAKKYIHSEQVLEDFVKANCVDEKLFKRALHDAVVYSWITDVEVAELKKKTKAQKKEDVEASFAKLLEKRAEYKKSKKA